MIPGRQALPCPIVFMFNDYNTFFCLIQTDRDSLSMVVDSSAICKSPAQEPNPFVKRAQNVSKPVTLGIQLPPHCKGGAPK